MLTRGQWIVIYLTGLALPFILFYYGLSQSAAPVYEAAYAPVRRAIFITCHVAFFVYFGFALKNYSRPRTARVPSWLNTLLLAAMVLLFMGLLYTEVMVLGMRGAFNR